MKKNEKLNAEDEDERLKYDVGFVYSYHIRVMALVRNLSKGRSN